MALVHKHMDRGRSGLKGMLQEFDIVVGRNSIISGAHIVIFDKDIIDYLLAYRRDEAYPGLLLSYPGSFMFLSSYNDNLLLAKEAYHKEAYDIMKVYRNPHLDPKSFKKMIMSDPNVDADNILSLFRNEYKQIWERK